jgi:GNAT superfamily N-acetyltransferase
MALRFVHFQSPINSTCCQTIWHLFDICFGREPDPEFQQRLNEKQQLLEILAQQNGNTVGFKIGYEKYRGVFFSWLGGVHPSFRRTGIARALLREQHAWCKDAGYLEIQTETFADSPQMLILNLQEGFEIFGTHIGGDRRLRVQLRKQLKHPVLF